MCSQRVTSSRTLMRAEGLILVAGSLAVAHCVAETAKREPEHIELRQYEPMLPTTIENPAFTATVGVRPAMWLYDRSFECERLIDQLPLFLRESSPYQTHGSDNAAGSANIRLPTWPPSPTPLCR